MIEPGGLDLRDHDVVRLLQQRHALGRHLAQDAHGESGAGKGLALQDLGRHRQLAADAPHLILKKIAQGFNEFQLHVSGKPPTL